MGCGNVQNGEMHVPPLGATTMVEFLDFTQLMMQAEEADFISLKLPVSKLTSFTEELLFHVSRGILARFDGHRDGLSCLQKYNNFTLNSRGCSMNFLPSCRKIPTYRAVVNPIVNLSKETLTQDLAHCDVTSGNSVFI